MTFSEALVKLQAKGLLKPLDPKPIPHPMPRRYNPNAHCRHNQRTWPSDRQMYQSVTSIQNLIDQQVITPPSSTSHLDFV